LSLVLSALSIFLRGWVSRLLLPRPLRIGQVSTAGLSLAALRRASRFIFACAKKK
jgi:hypothetical protein